MAAPAKFLFDMDFGAPDKAREKPATAAEIAQKIAAAEAIAPHMDLDLEPNISHRFRVFQPRIVRVLGEPEVQRKARHLSV